GSPQRSLSHAVRPRTEEGLQTVGAVFSQGCALSRLRFADRLGDHRAPLQEPQRATRSGRSLVTTHPVGAAPIPRKRSGPKPPISDRTPFPVRHKQECHAHRALRDKSPRWSSPAAERQPLSTIGSARTISTPSAAARLPLLPFRGPARLSRPIRRQRR